jgi:DNA ligase-1
MKAMSYLDKKTGKPQYSPTGWYVSEKFDGQRAHWSPSKQRLFSRYGNMIHAPAWFLDHFRHITIPLDGELFMGYGNWGLTGTFRSADINLETEGMWRKAKYMIFDIPDTEAGTYLERMTQLEKLDLQTPLIVVKRTLIDTRKTLEDIYQDILKRGGEGVMLNNPGAFYHDGRTEHILKYKPIMNEECIVIGYKPGNGKYRGKLGSFIVWPVDDGVPIRKNEFSISGMTDIVRSNYQKTHPIGTVLSYSCNDYTKSGKPRFPRYKGKCDKIIMLPETFAKIMKQVKGPMPEPEPEPKLRLKPELVAEPEPEPKLKPELVAEPGPARKKIKIKAAIKPRAPAKKIKIRVKKPVQA